MATSVTADTSAAISTIVRETRLAPVLRLGFWSAVATALFSIAFSVTGLLGLVGMLSFPWNPVIPDGASFGLALSFVIMMASVHHSATHPLGDAGSDRSIWSQIGLAFASMYAGLVCLVYMVIITLVVPTTLRGQAGSVAPFVFNVDGSFMQAVDGLGYFLMCLATWFAAPVFAGPAIEPLAATALPGERTSRRRGAPCVHAASDLVALLPGAESIVGDLDLLSPRVCGADRALLFARGTGEIGQARAACSCWLAVLMW